MFEDAFACITEVSCRVSSILRVSLIGGGNTSLRSSGQGNLLGGVGGAGSELQRLSSRACWLFGASGGLGIVAVAVDVPEGPGKVAEELAMP